LGLLFKETIAEPAFCRLSAVKGLQILDDTGSCAALRMTVMIFAEVSLEKIMQNLSGPGRFCILGESPARHDVWVLATIVPSQPKCQ
jgi:hypothetical protein